MNVRFIGFMLCASALVAACGDDDTLPSAPVNPSCGTPPAAEKPAASCTVTIEKPPVGDPIAAGQHVAEGTAITYCSNPPSSGPHYGVWADFREYTTSPPWPYLVHSLEHGAVILLYKCEAACPDIVDALRAVRERAVDPTCGANKRVILMPSASIPTKVAAAAWGATYTADCVDGPTLDRFVANGFATPPPENLCNAGRTF